MSLVHCSMSEPKDATARGEGLQLDETDKQKFRHGATGYGVELYGGVADSRISELRDHFDEPLVTVDCREADTSGEVIDMALREFGIDEEKIDRLAMGPFDLRKVINQTEKHFAILEFDSLGFKEQRSVAQIIKGLAEGLNNDDIMLGFTSSMGGAVTSANPDLSMRVRSWQVGPENDEYGSLSDFTVGDEIKTSARKTPMQVKSVERTPTNHRKLIAKNHYGEYELHGHNEGSVTLYAGNEVIRNVEVNHTD